MDKKTKIVILGSTGMLGNTVGKFFSVNFPVENVYLSYRNENASYGFRKFQFDPLCKFDSIGELSSIPKCDYIINCIGVIKPFINNNMINSIFINSIFPRELANYCEKKNIKLIHITTDCVFSGKDGNYYESDFHDSIDAYGKTKSLGEPENCMVLRTSIIGEEIHNNVSLISWVKKQEGKTINGFTNHIWNGITTLQYARICKDIIDNNLYEKELFHIHSNKVTKFELVSLIAKRFNVGCEIKEAEDACSIDRSLASTKKLNEKLNIPTIEKMINEI